MTYDNLLTSFLLQTPFHIRLRGREEDDVAIEEKMDSTEISSKSSFKKVKK